MLHVLPVTPKANPVMVYKDVLMYTLLMVKVINTHLSGRPGPPVTVEPAVLLPSTEGEAAVVVLTARDDARIELAQERLSIPQSHSEAQLKLQLADAQQSLLLKLVDRKSRTDGQAVT
ncbi:MAG: hypothetical protein ABI765_13840 [Gemmatimonadota bacterium]